MIRDLSSNLVAVPSDKVRSASSIRVFCRWLAAGIGWRYRALLQYLRRPGSIATNLSSGNHYGLEGGGYDAAKYWSERHSRFRRSFRGVGDMTRTDEENIEDYVGAVNKMAELLRSIGCDPQGKSMLDVGCGNGFWTGIFQKWGVADYTGVDITDALFDLLRKRYPTLQFLAGKLERLPLRPGFGLITMIDVTQHVTDDAELRRMLNRLRSLLADDGVFLVTFWNQVRPQEDVYETFRPFSFYTDVLNGMIHTRPVRFRDKYIAAFYRSGRNQDEGSAQPLSRESILEIAKQILVA